MKLKFSIQYGTQWGQNLYVVLTYLSIDQTKKTERLMMTTSDGMEWQLETTVLESRKHPIASFSYFYQVEDTDGNVLRKEWDAIPRTYYFDSAKDYVMADLWRDVPLQYHLYSLAYHTTMGLAVDQQVEPLRVPLYRKTILFRVSAPQLQKGQSVAILGSHPALGSWNVARYLRMESIGRFEWLLSVNVDAVLLPIEYKYVIIDDATHALLAWEEGDNRTTAGLLPADQTMVPDGTVLVAYGENLRVKEHTWRAAGVVIPVFSLRSKQSYGVGDFGDLYRLVDWCAATGMKAIQLLPVNDTTCSKNWSDSYPYNIVSAFALHPHYLDIEAVGVLKNKIKMNTYHRQRQELNALGFSDYEAVDHVKRAYIQELFDEKGQQTLESKEFKAWFAQNQDWLGPYAKWLDSSVGVIYFTQYHLHLQLKAAADYARSKGIFLKGDVPIGVNGDSVETANHPDYFHLDAQTGAPPDMFSPNGQNWGFPTYNWGTGVVEWFRRRLKWMEQYFDAIRIDHILGFFRIWEIPGDAVFGLLGHFSPSLPMTVGEIEYFGLPFRKDLFTRPFINDRVLDKLFGMHAPYVREHFLTPKSYGLYDLKSDYCTQKKVQLAFEGRTDENSLWIRDGLYRLVSSVLFLEDPKQPGMYHPRIGVIGEPVFEALNAEEKDAFMRLYNNYYYQRHNFFWGAEAIRKLTDVFGSTRMLCCGEDLGMLPDCVAPVLDQLRILSLEIQSMPKQSGYEFAHLDGNPYRSVATISTHDMSPLRLWWSESPERTQRFYVSMLQKQGRAPEQLPAHLAEEIIGRHLYCPSMLCMLSLQDWLAMDGELRSKNVREERINVPSDPYNRWKYRMHITIEDLLKADKYNNKVKTMIQRSKR
ncbi:4-alpha-glucanotransferase [Xylanibacter ruminicola]|uniref:4-alpha-glucanotransferase n=1 Tax=Xylanibacter ruminicola TaxID=839 RepID=A0A1H4F1K0_XYLRU|nr:4-alpha-glucanotransferase [Xylanibacter ruminicola]SEA91089.1 4-alpha-glucanotransferase [Xylanibacter ruminicola]